MTSSDVVLSMVTDLRRQRDVAQGEVAAAQQSLARSQARLAQLQTAIEALTNLYGLAEQVTPTTEDDQLTVVEELGTSSATAGDVSTTPGVGQKRIQSTALVADVVRDSDKPMTREDIRREFHERGLVPANWKNPDNAIGNAVARAAQRGMIVEVRRGLFTKPGGDSAALGFGLMGGDGG